MTDPAGNSDRFNAMIDRGWLARLKPVEWAVWCVYERNVDPQGFSAVGSNDMAKAIGHGGKGHIGRARDALACHGLIRIVDEARAQRAFRVQLLDPPSPPSSPRSTRERRPAPVREGSQIGNRSQIGTVPESGTSQIGNGPKSGTLRGGQHSRAPLPDDLPDARPAKKLPKPAATAVEAIYQSYPLKLAKPKALEAIERAIAAVSARGTVPEPAQWLLERTKAYAAVRATAETNLTAGDFLPPVPHPTTFFNQARYDDDPSTWGARPGGPRRSKNGNGHQQRPGEYAEDIKLDVFDFAAAGAAPSNGGGS